MRGGDGEEASGGGAEEGEGKGGVVGLGREGMRRGGGRTEDIEKEEGG